MSAAAARSPLSSSSRIFSSSTKLTSLQTRILTYLLDAEERHEERWVPMRLHLLAARFGLKKCTVCWALRGLLKAQILERRVVWVKHQLKPPSRHRGASMANEYRLAGRGGCR